MDWKKWKLGDNWGSFTRWWILLTVLSTIAACIWGVNVDRSFLGTVEMAGLFLGAWFIILLVFTGCMSMVQKFISVNFGESLLFLVSYYLGSLLIMMK
ncbi:hypothetical protein [Neobacillus sp. Marseille-QA0830]